VGGVLDELQWISLLRSAGAYQMFRQSRQQAIEPKAVASFLLLTRSFRARCATAWSASTKP
jgi:Uncharacterized protein conserved in bacteria